MFFYVSFVIQVHKDLQQTTDGLCPTATAGSTDLFPDISTQWKLYVFRGGGGESPVSTLTHKRRKEATQGQLYHLKANASKTSCAHGWAKEHSNGCPGCTLQGLGGGGTYCQFMSTQVSRRTAQYKYHSIQVTQGRGMETGWTQPRRKRPIRQRQSIYAYGP